MKFGNLEIGPDAQRLNPGDRISFMGLNGEVIGEVIGVEKDQYVMAWGNEYSQRVWGKIHVNSFIAADAKILPRREAIQDVIGYDS
jgi:hypothetical protein